MKTYEGNIEITKESAKEWGAKLKGVKKITGYLYINVNASLTADNLESVGGGLYINANASLPSLESVGGGLYIYANASLPSLESVGGGLSIYANAKLTAPKCKANLGKGPAIKSFLKRGYLFADNILSRIISKRKQGEIVVYKTTKIGNRDKVFYVVQSGEKYSHGETVKKAIADLRYKIGSRDTTKYKAWGIDTVKPTEQMIEAFRVITGACETGTRSWCEGKTFPARMSVKVAIRATKGAYGAESFAAFFKGAK